MSNVAQISRISLWKSKRNVRDTHLIQRFRHTVILDVTSRKNEFFFSVSHVKYSKIVLRPRWKVLARRGIPRTLLGEALERRRRAHDRQTRGLKEPAKCTRRGIYRTISNGTTVNIGFCRRERAQGSNVFLVKWSNYPDLSVT